MHDTSPEARDVQLDIYRKMSPEARLATALELGRTSRRLLREGVRLRHPEYTEEQVRFAELRLWLGPDDFRKVYPDAPELDP